MSASLFPATNLRCIINGEKEFVFFRKLIFEAVLLVFSALMYSKVLMVSVKIEASPSPEKPGAQLD